MVARPAWGVGLLAAGLLGGLSAVAAPPAPDAVPTPPALRQFLDTVQTFRSPFTQAVFDSRGRAVESSAGEVVMQRPGRFRWDYATPYVRTIVADGERLWLYEADLEQVTVRRLSDGLGDTPAALLTGRDDVLKRFAVQRAWEADGLAWSALRPRTAEGDFAELRLGFRGNVLLALELDDRLGQRTRIDFQSPRLNAAVPADTFRFMPPAGADVIDDAEL
ncbi:MAG: outer membrane lipoprotein chaperone LolA [Chromatiales bacterium]|jgi:outer membrane lipoprotein carrier protein|nr:outer membrane lipoprotein chaperone LolA [Chromatiales bacterium]